MSNPGTTSSEVTASHPTEVVPNKAHSAMSLPEKLWELLRRNETFKKDVKKLLAGDNARQYKVIQATKLNYAKVALRWMLPPNNIHSAGPRVVGRNKKKFMERSISLENFWADTPDRFKQQFKTQASAWSGLDPAVPLQVELVDMARIAASVSEIHATLTAGKAKLPEVKTRLYTLGFTLSRLARCKVFALPDVVYYEGRLERELANELKKYVAISPKRKSHPVAKSSLLGTHTQWRTYHKWKVEGPKFDLAGCNPGQVRRAVDTIESLISEVYPSWRIKRP